MELGRGLNYRAVPVIYEKALKIFAQSCTWNDVYKKAIFQDRKIGNTPKFPSMEIYDIRQHCDDTFQQFELFGICLLFVHLSRLLKI